MRKAQSKKWRLWGVTIAGAIALLGGIAPVAAQTNPPSAAQSAELAEAEQLNGQLEQLYKEGKYGEAIFLAQKVLAILEKVLGKEH